MIGANWTVDGLANFLGLVLMLRGLATMLTMPIDGAARSWSAALGLLGRCRSLCGRTGQPHFSSRNQV